MSMSAPRRQVNAKIAAATFACIFLVASGFFSPSILAGTSERVVVDRHSGLAISGFDPVAYFTEARPIIGRAEFEQEFAQATWRFRNEGNRSAFLQDPGTYMPRFGGYDPVALSRGVAT